MRKIIIILCCLLLASLSYGFRIVNSKSNQQTLLKTTVETQAKINYNALTSFTGTIAENFESFKASHAYGPPVLVGDRYRVTVAFGQVNVDVFFKYFPQTDTLAIRIKNPDKQTDSTQDQCLSASFGTINGANCGGHLEWVHGRGERQQGFTRCPQVSGSHLVEFWEGVVKAFMPNGNCALDLIDGSHVYCDGTNNALHKIYLKTYNPLLKNDANHAQSFYMGLGYRPSGACANTYNNYVTAVRGFTIGQALGVNAIKPNVETLLDTHIPQSLQEKWKEEGWLKPIAIIRNYFASKYKDEWKGQPLWRLFHQVDQATAHLANVPATCDAVANIMNTLKDGNTGTNTFDDNIKLLFNTCTHFVKTITKP